MSPLQKARLNYIPKLPKIFENLNLELIEGEELPISKDVEPHFKSLRGLSTVTFEKGESLARPLKVGVVLSGGQAAGGHNVIVGIYDSLKKIHGESQLFGFLDGPSGIIEHNYVELTEEFLSNYRNQGGFDLIGSGRTKIEKEEDFQASAKIAHKLDLDGLVIIGGDDSNTNAALLAEYFNQNGIRTAVVGVPKTIDGDLKNEYIECSFGFDTACKTFSEIIGNIERDSLSAKKYYFFIKMMGRSASHVALESALMTHPNLTFIGEEIAEKGKTLKDVIDEVTNLICDRAKAGKNYGVVLIPEGLIEFIPDVGKLIGELNLILSRDGNPERDLSDQASQVFNILPKETQNQLMMDRDPHGNVQVSKIESDRLLINLVKQELKKREDFQGKFSAQPYFCGYEGRSCLPSNFDSNYCYGLGFVASLLILNGRTGYIAVLRNLNKKPEDWIPMGVPLASMIYLEERKGKMKPVIEKALVKMDGAPFQNFAQHRDDWRVNDEYLYPGPIQFFGSEELTDPITNTLTLESKRDKEFIET